MDDSLRNLFMHFRNYMVGDVGAKVIMLAFWPLLSYLLTASDFGTIAVFTSTLVLLTPLLSLNVYTSITRYHFEPDSNIGGFLSTILVFTIAIVVGFGLLLIAARTFWSELSGLPVSVILLLIPMVLFTAVVSIYSQYCRAIEFSARLSRLNIVTTLLYVSLSLVYVFTVTEPTYWNILTASLTTQAVVSIFIISKLLPLINYKAIAWPHLRYAMAFGIPLIPYTISSEVLASFDVLMINAMESAESAGLYSFGYRIGAILLIVISALNAAWTPKYMRYMNDECYDKHEVFSRQLLKTSFIVAAVLVCFGDIGVRLVASNVFSESGMVVSIVAVGYCFYMLFVIYNKHTTYIKKMIFQSLVTLGAGLINIWLNMMLIPKYGYMAAAYTTVASFMLMALFAYLVNRVVIGYPVISLSVSFLYISPIIMLLTGKQVILAFGVSEWVNWSMSSLSFLIVSIVYLHPSVRLFRVPVYE